LVPAHAVEAGATAVTATAATMANAPLRVAKGVLMVLLLQVGDLV
jgi:hypothetical protein